MLQKWKTCFVVLRPNTLSIYKDEKESKLRHQVHLSDLSAVTFLKDPKHKRQNLFGLFCPARNFHFQAPTPEGARGWLELIRREARLEEDQEELFLASPLVRSVSPNGLMAVTPGDGVAPLARETMLSSSPETFEPPTPGFLHAGMRRESSALDSSGLSGNELPSHSDLSDNEHRMRGASIESSSVPLGQIVGSVPGPGMPYRVSPTDRAAPANAFEQDPDRVIWQGWLHLLRSKGGVRQWKRMWGVLRPRNLIMYKDESEYLAQWIVQLPAIVDIVDIDAQSRTKVNCFQVITEEKSYKFCAPDEESLVLFVGALKSLLAKRKMSAAAASKA